MNGFDLNLLTSSLSPFHYLIEGLLGQGSAHFLNDLSFQALRGLSVAIGQRNITCTLFELVALNPPRGLSCGEYLQSFTSVAGGYLTNPAASEGCLYCPFRTTDEYLGSTFNIFFHNRWKDAGILIGFCILNVSHGLRYLTKKVFNVFRSCAFTCSRISGS